MSYEKHTWETGETITAEKLNNLENGLASFDGGGTVDAPILSIEITDSGSGEILNKTYREIETAIYNNYLIYARKFIITNPEGRKILYDYTTKFPTRVERNSEYTWCVTIDGKDFEVTDVDQYPFYEAVD